MFVLRYVFLYDQSLLYRFYSIKCSVKKMKWLLSGQATTEYKNFPALNFGWHNMFNLANVSFAMGELQASSCRLGEGSKIGGNIQYF